MGVCAKRGVVCVLLVGVWVALILPHYAAWTPETPPVPRAPRPVLDVVCDRTPVRLSVTHGWQKQQIVVPAWRVRSDWTVWRAMRFDDWGSVPDPVRSASLTRMVEHYSRLIDQGPPAWRTMTAFDWEMVPSPVRAIATLRMVDAWVVHYGGAPRSGISDRQISDTIAAIIMVESWFEHTAVNTSATGNRDLGLAQASDSCRRTLARLARDGAVDFTMAEEDYFNPWKATRVATFWFLRLLGQARGDLDLAIRAYHEGIMAARRGAGGEYLANVLAKRRTYMRNDGAGPAWGFMFVAARFRSDGVRVTPAAARRVSLAADRPSAASSEALRRD